MLQIQIQPNGITSVTGGFQVIYKITDNQDQTIPEIDGSFLISDASQIDAQLAQILQSQIIIQSQKTGINYIIDPNNPEGLIPSP